MGERHEGFVDRGEARIHYEAVGGGGGGSLPLLLTHGFAASSAMWEPNVAGLSASREVVTWDIRGHGRTVVAPRPELFSQDASVGDMAAVLDACGIGRAAIGGLSLGGFLSLAFHCRFPERVGALVLCDTGPGYRNDDGRRTWNDYAVSQAERFDSAGLDALADSPEVRSARHDPAGLALAARHILTQHGPEVIESLASIAVPTLVLVGELDKPFLKSADYMAARIPGAEKWSSPERATPPTSISPKRSTGRSGSSSPAWPPEPAGPGLDEVSAVQTTCRWTVWSARGAGVGTGDEPR